MNLSEEYCEATPRHHQQSPVSVKNEENQVVIEHPTASQPTKLQRNRINKHDDSFLHTASCTCTAMSESAFYLPRFLQYRRAGLL